jgi:muconolactone delta-isomerase
MRKLTGRITTPMPNRRVPDDQRRRMFTVRIHPYFRRRLAAHAKENDQTQRRSLEQAIARLPVASFTETKVEPAPRHAVC